MALAITETICETIIIVVTLGALATLFSESLYFISFLISERDRKSDD